MINQTPKSLIFTIAIIFGMVPAFGQACQEFEKMGERVYEIDQLADQMVFRYQWELRFNQGCKDSVSLLTQMQRHSELTNDLVRAYRNKNFEGFDRVVSQVRDSIITMQNLQKRARLSDDLTGIISESASLIKLIPASSGIEKTFKKNT